ncbi:hypothetical protein [Streptococcus acidominimus]|uniref:CopG family transcriptional regulator n=1 Tax=Streptococcus acidominimus TaxID=1326 RepID=A0A4Y9FQ97_STRAI|nr:hypothetical protein [Streptococcus acidominimus]MBF0818281.1 hypothetical protein [Streptococcus acidominimus]MBF0838802.1 hypothetical protein [Streptococcus acidominimus]MBF0845931.1 hypothetical protein [Streptococcus danieliae]TFU31351.1 hypothetical protein E4U01_02255 [Streptococcus acidominimus]
MSAKMGRPLKSDKPRSKNIGFRVTDEQFEMLEECVRLTGKSKTDIIALGLEKVYQELKG